MTKPSLFVGSSTEGLAVARAFRGQLADEVDVAMWDEGVFRLGATFIESLVSALPRFDFAALILTPDDPVIHRNDHVFGPRDNVIFELGLFMGRLGRERTFIVQPSGDRIKLPSDLAGVSVANYEWPLREDEVQASIGVACTRIREAIRSLGYSPTKVLAHVHAVEEEQARQRQEIETLKFLVQNFVTGYELVHLGKLARGEPFPFKPSGTFESELRRLLAMGLIGRFPGRGIRSLFQDGDDVGRHLFITEPGRKYLELRQSAEEDD